MRISDWSSDVCSSDLQILEQRDIDPALAGIIVEQFALDPATCGEVGIASDENSARIGPAHCRIKHHAADRVGRDLIPGILQLSIDMRDRKSTRLNSSH